MKNLIFAMGLAVLLVSCQKVEPIETAPTSSTGKPVNVSNPTVTFDATGQKLLYQGDFMGNVHPTSGMIKLYEKDGKRTLVFSNFKTDPGPDLRIYLAEDKVATNSTELSNKVLTGDYFVELPTNANPQKQKFVLIWCKQFSVLFGNAELK